MWDNRENGACDQHDNGDSKGRLTLVAMLRYARYARDAKPRVFQSVLCCCYESTHTGSEAMRAMLAT